MIPAFWTPPLSTDPSSTVAAPPSGQLPALDKIYEGTSDDGWNALKRVVSTLVFEHSPVLYDHLVPVLNSSSSSPFSSYEGSIDRIDNSIMATGPSIFSHLRTPSD